MHTNTDDVIFTLTMNGSLSNRPLRRLDFSASPGHKLEHVAVALEREKKFD